ncbi:MAG: PTPA-CTERM sorting domain-containing protein [Limnothrix sp.]
MKFSPKNLIPAAAFAAVASVAISAPAQALSLNGSIDYMGGAVTWTGSGSGATANYDFDFGVSQFSATTMCEGDFSCPDSITFNDFSIVNGTASAAGSIIDGIATTLGGGTNVSFFLTGVNASETATGVTLGLSGFFSDGAGNVFGTGNFSSQLSVRQDGSTTLSGNLITDVPTPAAVMPILAGLFGAASKRKRSEEENA